MDRSLSLEEKLRKAEEIYERRKSGNYRENTSKINISKENNDFRLLKKMIIQILICLLIYFIFYLIQTTNYVFSASTISKTKEILEYDIDINEIYLKVKNNFIPKENENVKEAEKVEKVLDKKDDEPQEAEKKEESKLIEEEVNEEKKEESTTSVEEIVDAPQVQFASIPEEIKAKYSINKPAEGKISSEFGTREPEGDIVTAYHHGIDIAVVTGTEIKSATDGTVTLSTESNSYGKYIKVQNGDLVTLYAHCSSLLKGEGEEVKQGEIIALSGATGKVTGPHLHFEVIYKGEYINPRDVLEF